MSFAAAAHWLLSLAAGRPNGFAMVHGTRTGRGCAPGAGARAAAALARAGRAAQRDELEHPTKRHSQKQASRADAQAKEDAATILDILISIIRHYYS